MYARLGRHTLNAANAFSICNSGRFALNLGIPSTASSRADFTLPPTLTPILVSASSAAAQLTLTLTPAPARSPIPSRFLPRHLKLRASPPAPTRCLLSSARCRRSRPAPPTLPRGTPRSMASPEPGMRFACALSPHHTRVCPLMLVTGICAGASAVLAGTDDSQDTVLRAA